MSMKRSKELLKRSMALLLSTTMVCGILFSGCSNNEDPAPSKFADVGIDDPAVPAETEELSPPPTETVDYSADEPETMETTTP